MVSTEARTVLAGSVVDYGAALRPPSFRVTRNPNTAERCACNRSFGRPWPGRGHPGLRGEGPDAVG